jgi:uncharacterized lipoprotein YajG
MQENGKLFSFLVVICCVFLLLGFPSQKALAQRSENYYCVDTVTNSIKIGQFAGNRNLAFGVKNIAEEALSEKDFELSSKEDATYHITIELIFFDLEQSKTNFGVFHKDANTTVIRMRGKLIIDGTVIKTAIAEEKSSEIATSTFVVSEGGVFNQQSASNALKKTCISLINQLTKDN